MRISRWSGKTGLLIILGAFLLLQVAEVLQTAEAREEGIILAAKEGDAQLIETLLAANPELVKATDSEIGATALHWAAIYGRKEAVRVLLRHNAEVNATERHAGTTMHWACHFNDSEVVDWLLDRGAWIDHQNQMGRTPLHVAARRGCLDVASRLIERGADLRATIKDGSTALHIAARNGHKDVVVFLIAAGIPATAKNDKGETYLDILFTRPKTISMDPKKLEGYAGRYAVGTQVMLDIRKEGDHLYYYAYGKNEILPLSETEFITSAEVNYFTFVLGEDGRAVAVTSGSGELKATRVPEGKEEAVALPQAEDEIPVEVVRLSDRVIVLKEDVMGNNVTAVASKKGLVVVDNSGFPSTATKMRGIIAKEFNRSDFAYVINTHFHWDHAWGNQVFPEATIVGHAGCPAMMERDKEYAAIRVQNMRERLGEQKAKLGQADPNSEEADRIRRSIKQMERDIKDHSEGFVITKPQITFNDRMTLDLGDLTMKMFFFGRAHSGTDIFILIPEEGILLTGDIFLDRRWLPLFAGQPELDIPKWIEVLHTVLDGEDKLARVIPGHLDLWTPEKLDLWRDYIVDLWSSLRKAKEESLGFEAAAARLPLAEKFFYLRENGHSDARIQEFHRANLEAFWSQLVESAARLVQEAMAAGGTEAGLKKFADLRSRQGSYFFNERQFNMAGYGFLSSGRVDEAIALFQMNIELFPDSWNVYDSLAEAYAVKGEKEPAIKYYDKALQLNPDNQNAKERLKNLKKS